MMLQRDTQLWEALDRTLRYYAFFRCPLTAGEIHRYCGVACSLEQVERYVAAQVALGNLHAWEGHFTIHEPVQALLEQRRVGGAKAAKDIEAARRVARFIYQFPFVSFVGISGSLSKGYADAQSDFDFFIITRSGRLWIARTLLHVFKKLTFLVGQQHKFCMNYFIDETALTLQEQNIYTATELCTMVPVCGEEVYERFMVSNYWVADRLPNFEMPARPALAANGGLLKKWLEGVFNVAAPARLNAALMRFTDRKWQRKWAKKNYPQADYDLAFKTRINISKNHHLNYQKRILSVLELEAN